MTRKIIPAAALILFASACSHHADLTLPQTQDNFGVQMAKMNLWREALFRFQRAVDINPNDAMAHNNLAVAWEANGDFEKARKEYLEALKLDRSNQYIQKNYSRYVEFLSRNRKRQPKDVKTAASTPTTRHRHDRRGNVGRPHAGRCRRIEAGAAGDRSADRSSAVNAAAAPPEPQPPAKPPGGEV